MPAVIPRYEYDIFISYRQKDNKRDKWVTQFVEALRDELDATLKDTVTIYFDQNPHDGLRESHDVDRSLERKLNCLIFIPVISMTYCDPACFAWQHELLPFIKRASEDSLGMNIQVPHGNVASRILPVKIHSIDVGDEALLCETIGSTLRAIDFIFQGNGVNRPLRMNEINPSDNTLRLNYRDQLNKVANAVKDRVIGALAITNAGEGTTGDEEEIHDSPVLFKEKVKQRDLLKVGLVYLIISLLIWKVISLSAPLLQLPGSVPETALIILVAFLPVAIVLAWLFERGPSGFISTNSLEAKNNPFTSKQKKPLTSNASILVLLVIMLVLYLIPKSTDYKELSAHDAMAENKSIAVLYFDNMSGDSDQEYFSDGITEEIISRLANVEGLRVISRTSVRTYKDKPIGLKQIADELNVSVILAGSIRKEEQNMKVAAQLINAETDEYIWAETYERELTGVFEVQAEIANQIADRFHLTSKVGEEHDRMTFNPEAYDYFLQAKNIAFYDYYYSYDSIDFIRAKLLYEKAIAKDSQFVEAYAGLADLYDALRQSDIENFPPHLDSLRFDLLRKAVAINPNSPFVNTVSIWALLNRDEPLFDSAFYHAKKAVQVDPLDYYSNECMGQLMARKQLYDVALPYFKEALNFNPINAQINAELGYCFWQTGNLKEAEKHFDRAFELEQHDAYSSIWYTIDFLTINGQFDKARLLHDNMDLDDPELLDAFEYLKEGNSEKVEEIASSMEGFGRAELYARIGKKEKAIESLQSLIDTGVTRYLILTSTEPWLSLKNDEAFKQIVDEHRRVYLENKLTYGIERDKVLVNK